MASISTIPNELDLQLYQGAPLLAVFSVTDSGGNPVNMTGGSIVSAIRATQSRTGTLIATPTVTWVNQAAGQFNLTLTSAQTDAFTFAGNAYWDCFYVDTNTPVNETPLFWGTVSLQVDISY